MSAFVERLTGYALLDPAWLLALAALPVALLVRSRDVRPSLQFAPGDLGVPSSWRVRTVGLPLVLAVLGLVLVVLALARPAERTALPRESEGIDIMLCLDTSSSMTAQDMDPERTRLAIAREAAAAFIARRDLDRIGLVTFARYPDLRCPLTRDHEALARILAAVETVRGDGPEDATGLGSAIVRAAQVMQAAPQRSRVVILLTDGEENVAVQGATGEIPPAHAAQLCEQLGVRVYAISVGLERIDARGRRVALDRRPLRRLALRTRGAFREARDADALQAVYAGIDALEKAPLREPEYVHRDRFLAFLLPGLALLLLGALLRATLWAVAP